MLSQTQILISLTMKQTNPMMVLELRLPASSLLSARHSALFDVCCVLHFIPTEVRHQTLRSFNIQHIYMMLEKVDLLCQSNWNWTCKMHVNILVWLTSFQVKFLKGELTHQIMLLGIDSLLHVCESVGPGLDSVLCSWSIVHNIFDLTLERHKFVEESWYENKNP